MVPVFLGEVCRAQLRCAPHNGGAARCGPRVVTATISQGYSAATKCPGETSL